MFRRLIVIMGFVCKLTDCSDSTSTFGTTKPRAEVFHTASADITEAPSEQPTSSNSSNNLTWIDQESFTANLTNNYLTTIFDLSTGGDSGNFLNTIFAVTAYPAGFNLTEIESGEKLTSTGRGAFLHSTKLDITKFNLTQTESDQLFTTTESGAFLHSTKLAITVGNLTQIETDQSFNTIEWGVLFHTTKFGATNSSLETFEQDTISTIGVSVDATIGSNLSTFETSELFNTVSGNTSGVEMTKQGRKFHFVLDDIESTTTPKSNMIVSTETQPNHTYSPSETQTDLSTEQVNSSVAKNEFNQTAFRSTTIYNTQPVAKNPINSNSSFRDLVISFARTPASQAPTTEDLNQVTTVAPASEENVNFITFTESPSTEVHILSTTERLNLTDAQSLHRESKHFGISQPPTLFPNTSESPSPVSVPNFEGPVRNIFLTLVMPIAIALICLLLVVGLWIYHYHRKHKHRGKIYVSPTRLAPIKRFGSSFIKRRKAPILMPDELKLQQLSGASLKGPCVLEVDKTSTMGYGNPNFYHSSSTLRLSDWGPTPPRYEANGRKHLDKETNGKGSNVIELDSCSCNDGSGSFVSASVVIENVHVLEEK